MNSSSKPWKSLPLSIHELNIEKTLACGQSFRWKELNPGEWTGVIRDEVWKFRQTSTELSYQVYTRNDNPCSLIRGNNITSDVKPPKVTEKTTKEELEQKLEISRQTRKRKQATKLVSSQPNKKLALLKTIKDENTTETDSKNVETINDYFQLSVKLVELYSQWAKADANFKEISSKFPGIRMLRQDPVENLFSFICSSNNHISRISAMVEKLCVNFGERITEIDGITYYQFPSISSLADDKVEQKLRDLGFGYRAKYINQTDKYITAHHNEEWLYSLRGLPYKEVKKELMKLCGVGAKVADCVCLMSMDQPGSIPVDTHVWQIAARHYIPKLSSAKSLTDKLYEEIGDHFRGLWGEYAGWAHSVLFAADLKKFKDVEKSGKSRKEKVK